MWLGPQLWRFMSSVLGSIPNKGWIRREVVTVILKLVTDNRHTCSFFMPGLSPTENNMANIVNYFCDGNERVKECPKGDFEWWLNIDADNPPFKNPLDLIDLDKDVMGLPTPIWSFGWQDLDIYKALHFNIYDYKEEHDNYTPHEPQEGLQEVDGIGFGCFLIHRRVFDMPNMRKAPCMRIWKEDGTVYRGLDLAFSGRAKAAGARIWAHYDYPCSHYKEVDLTQFSHVTNKIVDDVKGGDKKPLYGPSKKMKKKGKHSYAKHSDNGAGRDLAQSPEGSIKEVPERVSQKRYRRATQKG